MPPKTPKEALEKCRSAGLAGRYTVAHAAHERLKNSSLSNADVRHILTNARSCTRTVAENDAWLVEGAALDGSSLTLTVVFDGNGPVVL